MSSRFVRKRLRALQQLGRRAFKLFVAGSTQPDSEPWAYALGFTGPSIAALCVGLACAHNVGVAPQKSVYAVGVDAVISGGDMQRAVSGAARQLGVEVAAGISLVGEAVANVLCGVGDADGDCVIGDKSSTDDQVFGRGANARCRRLIERGVGHVVRPSSSGAVDPFSKSLAPPR
jgi:hypothetical protein